MKSLCYRVLTAALLFIPFMAAAQHADKLLIVHADDAGVSHATNTAIIAAFEKKAITSASIMVPCAWFPEIAAYAKTHPELDWGIHITLTAEWKNYKWGGVASSNEIASLLDKDGYFYTSVEEFARHAKPEEVRKEVRAQIRKAMAAGIRISHLDTHMGSLFGSPDLVKIYQELGKEFNLPVMIPMNMIHLMAPQMLPYIDTVNNVVVKQFISAFKAAPADKWHEYYDQALQQLTPGLNEIIFHLAYDNDEMQAVTTDHPDFGAAWRQQDLNYVMSDDFSQLLKKEGFRLVGWKDVSSSH